MRKVELFELIRKDYEMGLSRRAISDKRGIHRRMVRQAIASAIPPDRKPAIRNSPKLTKDVKRFIDGILDEDKTAPKKQRHTARRIWQRATAEKGSRAAESTVRVYVSKRRKQLGTGVPVFVPQHHEPGAQGEADFYEAAFDFPWGRETAQVITLRSEFSAGASHRAYPSQNQASMFEALEKGFEFAGGVFPVLRLDNLPLAVARVLRGGLRKESARFIAFRSHHRFDSSFTSPGKQGAHEKGGVEGEVGRFRRQWLTPVPKFGSWEEANDYLLACCIKDLDRTVEGQNETVGEAVMFERPLLKPLAAEGFEVAELAEAKVDNKSRVSVKRTRYSVPASLVGRQVHVKILPMKIEVSYGGKLVAVHERAFQKNIDCLVLDHYLDVLAEKPGAFPGSLPLHQARLSGEFSKTYDKLWNLLRARSGEKKGTKHMIEVLLLHRTYEAKVVRLAVNQALEANAIDSGAVALFARHLAEAGDQAFEVPPIDVGDLCRFDRPLPETTIYDELLLQGAGA